MDFEKVNKKNEELMGILEEFDIPVVYKAEIDGKNLMIKDTVGAVVSNNVFSSKEYEYGKLKKAVKIVGISSVVAVSVGNFVLWSVIRKGEKE